MGLRQSKRSLTFRLRPLDNTFSRSEGLILSGIHIPSYCDDSFTAKPREQGELPTGAVPVKVDFFRVVRDVTSVKITSYKPTYSGVRGFLRFLCF